MNDCGHKRPVPPLGYIVSFVPLHERGVGTPGSDFFRELLFAYEVELHHLNPNGVQLTATFAALCEGYLGVLPCLNLFTYFFTVQWETRGVPQPTSLALGSACETIRLGSTSHRGPPR